MSVRSSLNPDEVDKGVDRFKFILRACALKAPGLLLAEGAPTVRWGKTFWRVGQFFFYENGHSSETKSRKIHLKVRHPPSRQGLQTSHWRNPGEFWAKIRFPASMKMAVSLYFRPRPGPLSMWVIFLVAQMVPPSFVDHGPKLRVLIIAKCHRPEMAQNLGEPRKMTQSSETESFSEVVWKSRFQNKKSTFGPKYQNFRVKIALFCP